MEIEGHSGSIQIQGVPRCECGALATRLVGQCENCWKTQSKWPRKLSPKAIAAAEKKAHGPQK